MAFAPTWLKVSALALSIALAGGCGDSVVEPPDEATGPRGGGGNVAAGGAELGGGDTGGGDTGGAVAVGGAGAASTGGNGGAGGAGGAFGGAGAGGGAFGGGGAGGGGASGGSGGSPGPAAPQLAASGFEPPRVRSTNQAATIMASVSDPDGDLATVVADLSALGLSAAAPLVDDGTLGDQVAGDGIFSLDVADQGLSLGKYTASITASDVSGLSSKSDISFEVQPASPRWAHVTGTPPNAVADPIYDSANNRVVIFGGTLDWESYLDDVWTWSASGGFARLLPAGTPPVARLACSSVYDPIGQRLIVFGGYGGVVPVSLGDVWELSLAAGTETWKELTPTGNAPGVRDGAAAFYDPVKHRMVVVGGLDSEANVAYTDLWALDLSPGAESWSKLSASGTPPIGVWEASVAYDATRKRALLFGGWAPSLNDEVDQLFSLDFNGNRPAWKRINTTGPQGRDSAVLVHDAAGGRFLAFSGFGVVTPQLNDLWALSDSPGSETWTELQPSGALPPARTGASGLLLPNRELWVWGGSTTVDWLSFADSWALDASVPGSESWRDLDADAPSPRSLPTMVYDGAAERFLLYGGTPGTGVSGDAALSDLWSFDLAGAGGWQALSEPQPAAPARYGAAWAYDAGQRDWFFGPGFDRLGAVDSAWTLNVTPSNMSWSAMGVTMAANALVVHDEANARLIILGCSCPSSLASYDLQTQVLRSLYPGGSAPALKASSIAGYDAFGERLIVFDPGSTGVRTLSLVPGATNWRYLSVAGTSPPNMTPRGVSFVSASGTTSLYLYGGADNDALWRLNLRGGQEAWSKVPVAGPQPTSGVRYGAGLAYDPVKNRMFFALGHGAVTANAREVWAIEHLAE